MRIVINHLTRMEAPRICVAGIDPDTGSHVRPTTPPSDAIDRELLTGNGGPFEVGAVVDLGDVTPTPSSPEIEDCRFSTAGARRAGRLDAVDYLQLLADTSSPDLESIFGAELERPLGGNFAVDKGLGDASLGVLSPRRRADLTVTYNRPKLKLNDYGKPAYLPVNDLRFYEDDQRTIRTDVLADARRRLQRGVDVTVMVGLARATQMPNDDRERHWLQVNGICLEDRPLGDRP
jgi:hypothetical protein